MTYKDKRTDKEIELSVNLHHKLLLALGWRRNTTFNNTLEEIKDFYYRMWYKHCKDDARGILLDNL